MSLQRSELHIQRVPLARWAVVATVVGAILAAASGYDADAGARVSVATVTTTASNSQPVATVAPAPTVRPLFTATPVRVGNWGP
jgi:hypothetical protein